MTKPDWLNIQTYLETVRPEHIATLRYSLVHICDGNFCAAMVLDQFYFDAYSLQKYSTYGRNHGRNCQEETTVTTTFEDVAAMMSNMFDKNNIHQALGLIANKGYATIQISQNYYICYSLHFKTVEKALDVYQGKQPTPITYSEAPLSPRNRTEPTPYTKATLTSVKQQYSRRSEAKVVKFHNKRAEMVALPATLTLEEWKTTLEDFRRKCAYCKVNDYQVLEHFIPLTSGGGTTKYNCVPACTSCNSIKGDQHPSILSAPSTIAGALPRVQKYLQMRKTDSEVAK